MKLQHTETKPDNNSKKKNVGKFVRHIHDKTLTVILIEMGEWYFPLKLTDF